MQETGLATQGRNKETLAKPRHFVLLPMCVVAFLLYLVLRFFASRFEYAIYLVKEIELMTSAGEDVYLVWSLFFASIFPFVMVGLLQIFKRLRSRKARLWIFFIVCALLIKQDISKLMSVPKVHAEFVVNDYLEHSQKELPKMASDSIRFDSVILNNQVLIQEYTFLEYPASEVEADYILEQVYPSIIDFVCSSDFTKHLSTLNLSMRFSYNGKDGNPVLSVERGVDDCVGVDAIESM